MRGFSVLAEALLGSEGFRTGLPITYAVDSVWQQDLPLRALGMLVETGKSRPQVGRLENIFVKNPLGSGEIVGGRRSRQIVKQ